MGRIRGRNTGLELVVRRLAHSMGYRYRLHDSRLPGVPDIVFRSRRKAIFVHGCFWHRHSCTRGESIPSTRVDFWNAKFEHNQSRDAKVRRQLCDAGWKVLVIWECEIKKRDTLSRRIASFLGPLG
jgi:DNA mismatch endonuclease (patch repair protein)